MVASAADDGVAPAVAEASAKLLASPEIDELEANYAKWGYLDAGLLGVDNLGKIHRVGPNLGQLQASIMRFLVKLLGQLANSGPPLWISGCGIMPTKPLPTALDLVVEREASV